MRFKHLFLFLLTFLISDPNAGISTTCSFDIFEHDNLIVRQTVEADGSIKWDISDIPAIAHKYRIRYWCSDDYKSDFVPYTIIKSCVDETCTYVGYEKGRMTLKH